LGAVLAPPGSEKKLRGKNLKFVWFGEKELIKKMWSMGEGKKARAGTDFFDEAVALPIQSCESLG